MKSFAKKVKSWEVRWFMYKWFNQRVRALGQSLCPVTSQSLLRFLDLLKLSNLLPNLFDRIDHFDQFCGGMCFPLLGNRS